MIVKVVKQISAHLIADWIFDGLIDTSLCYDKIAAVK